MKLQWSRWKGSPLPAADVEDQANRLARDSTQLVFCGNRLLVKVGPELYDCEIVRWARIPLTSSAALVDSDESTAPFGARRKEGDTDLD